MEYLVIYDGNCNLCSTLVQQLERWDQGQQFCYAPMQDTETLQAYTITASDCEKGMILINRRTDERWQGANAAEKIGLLLPLAKPLLQVYQSIPGLKLLGDTAYSHIRDNRYDWFGQCTTTYWSGFPRPKELDINRNSVIMEEAKQCESDCFYPKN